MPGPYTRAQLVTMVQDEVQDPNGRFFTTAKIQEFLNKGMAEWCEKTRARRATTTIDVTAEDATVDLSAVAPPVLEVLRVALPTGEDQDDELPLELVTLEQLEADTPDWRTQRGQPYRYLRWDQGHLAVRLWPEPDTAYASYARSGGQVIFDSLYGIAVAFTGLTDAQFSAAFGDLISAAMRYGGARVDYIAGSTDFTAGAGGDSQTPYTASGIPPEAHEAIAHYATARCLRMETSAKQRERALEYEAKFELDVASRRALARSEFQPTKPHRAVTFREL